MVTEVFLVAYENVEPNVLPALVLKDALVIMFVGAHQGKLSPNLVDTMQKLKGNGRYIRMENTSKNSFTMHLACYMRYLLTELPDAFFHIISKDHDYDPLLTHVNKVTNRATRWATLNDAIMGKHSPPIAFEPKEKVCKISNKKTKAKQWYSAATAKINYTEIIRSRLLTKKGLPATPKTLSNWLHALFPGKLNKAKITQIITQLEDADLLKIIDDKVIYIFEDDTTIV
jgi:hypothetical protein